MKWVKTIMQTHKMEKINPQETAALLEENGVIVTIAEAEAILDFLRMLAEIIVSNYLRQNADTVDNSNYEVGFES
jgi:hypothetical protein